MSLRFFADHCVPMEVVRRLRHEGHEVLTLRELMPPRSPDPMVIGKAQDLNCILLSLNGDFSDIVSYPPAKYKGIVALQLHNHPEIISVVMDRLAHYLAAHPNSSEYEGRLFLVEPHRIRIRS